MTETSSWMKTFDASGYTRLAGPDLKTVERNTYESIGHEVLTRYEHFNSLLSPPTLRGIPFDYLGFKQGIPHLIVYRDPLDYFRPPPEVLIRRLQEIVTRIEGLKVLLIQVSVSRATYRAMYNEEFTWRKMKGSNSYWQEDSILPVVDWVKDMIAGFERETG